MPHTIESISEKERATVDAAFADLMEPLSAILKGDDEVKLKKAYEVAVEGHKYQRRKSGEPYILHPIEVARICHQEIGLGPTAIICAILHDVVEDTEVVQDDILEMFGEKVSLIVDGLTKLDGLYNVESPQAENLKKVLSSLVYDVRVVLIKMADRIHNLRTIGPMPRHKQLKIAAETSYIYAPLAHRLGLYKIKTEFEDICMKITEPETYDDITDKIQQSEIERTKYINEFVHPIREKLDKLNIQYKVFGRPKSISSIWNKIKTKKVAFEEIYDLFAVRIVIDVPREMEKNYCWQVYSVFTDVYKPIPERLKDWVTNPKGNGYESLHTSVIGPDGRYVEVQIRSRRMDDIAERGFAAHWKYKGVKEGENVYTTWLNSIREILEAQHTNAVEFIDDFKTNLFNEEVYVFTPNGDMKILPKGATALDFAFAIHSDIGYRASAIKVNNKLVPMGHPLSNGDQVSVVTNKNQSPSEQWLNLVVTGKAKSKIRSSMKEERKKIGEIGKESLERKLKNMKLDFDTNVDILVKHYKFNSRVDLFYAITNDEFKLTELKNFQIVNNKLEFIESTPAVPEIKTEVTSKYNKSGKQAKRDDNKNLILVNGEPASMYDFSLSQCCTPVPGDDIFAFLSSTTGLKIHRVNCPNATHLMANYEYRMLKAEWSGATSRNFSADLLIVGVDSGVGVIQKLSNAISVQLGIDIRSFNIEGKEGYFEGKVRLMIKNKNQLNMIIQSLQKMDGISSVTRIDDSSTS